MDVVERRRIMSASVTSPAYARLGGGSLPGLAADRRQLVAGSSPSHAVSGHPRAMGTR
jgi:hypothetical protein